MAKEPQLHTCAILQLVPPFNSKLLISLYQNRKSQLYALQLILCEQSVGVRCFMQIENDTSWSFPYQILHLPHSVNNKHNKCLYHTPSAIVLLCMNYKLFDCAHSPKPNEWS